LIAKVPPFPPPTNVIGRNVSIKALFVADYNDKKCGKAA